jgi:hypothetical protein
LLAFQVGRLLAQDGVTLEKPVCLEKRAAEAATARTRVGAPVVTLILG